MRSWRVHGWPLSRPEAARPPPPSSLPSTAEWPGGTRAFPRWRERSRCTCTHETPTLGGTVRFFRPRPVIWQPLSRPKLTVLRARQPLPCTPWLSCRYTKPRRSNRCTRVVPTLGWCRSCARRLTSLYERRKSRRGPTGRRCPPMVHHSPPWWSSRHGRPPASSRAAPPQAESTNRPVRRASRRRAAPPRPSLGPKLSRKSTKRPWRGQPGDVGVCSFSGDGENSTAPSPGEMKGLPAVPTVSKKEQFTFSLGSQVHGMTVCDALPPHSRPRPILPVAKRVRFGDDIPPHAPLASPVRDPGSSVRMTQNAPPSVPSTPTLFRCSTTGTSIVPLEPLAQHLEAWLTLPSLSRWLMAHNSTRLRDSVRQATSQVQRRSRDVSGSPERPCLARGDCCPPGKGCNRAGPSSRDEAGVLQPLLHRTQERWWPSANPGSASLEPGFAQAPVQDADTQAHDQMHSAPGLVCSARPEGRLLSRFDPSAIQTVSTVCVRRSGMAIQGPPLRALPVSPCVHEGCRGRPYPVTGSGRQDPQLPRRLAYPSPIQSKLGDHRDLVLRHLSQLRLRVNWEKSKLSPVQIFFFSLCGVRLGMYDGTPHGGTCPSSAELPEFLQRQEWDTTETVSEAPGAYGIRSCSHAAQIAS